VKRGEEILKRTGAEDIASTSEAHADFAVSDKPMLRSRSPITEEPAAIIPENGTVDSHIARLHEETDPPRTRLDA
jgi:hypothetical protein